MLSTIIKSFKFLLITFNSLKYSPLEYVQNSLFNTCLITLFLSIIGINCFVYSINEAVNIIISYYKDISYKNSSINGLLMTYIV